MKKLVLSLLFLVSYFVSYSNSISIKDWTGSGFALKDGYVVTNYHVIDGATHVYIKGINGDFKHEYSATVVDVDKDNDLATLKIEDENFLGFGTIPYSIQINSVEIGEEIFVLGYPMTDIMGEDIKLTTGVINSCSGYKGDNGSYQISAPIQPGNSGGPLFNRKGEVIGVVNAKLLIAENAGYAIKSQYLSKYVASEPDSNIQSWTKTIKDKIKKFIYRENNISDLSLVEQVKMIKNFVFIIKCSVKPKLYHISYTTNDNKKLSLGNTKDVALHTFENNNGMVYLFKPSVPNELFKGCGRLKTININNDITKIGRNAFCGCSSLTHVKIPDSVTSIGEYAFSGCTSLINIKLPKQLTKIEEGTFSSCKELANLDLPNNITSIGNCAFCLSGIAQITIPNSVTYIGWGAFYMCDNITEITIPNGITTIETDTFYWCRGLITVTIPNSINTIAGGAFSSCQRLSHIYCKAIVPPKINHYGIFHKDCTIHVPRTSLEAYKSDKYWMSCNAQIKPYDF